MTEPEIYDLLNQIFREVLEDDTIVLTPATTAEDVEGWDSMNHIFIVVELEKRFGVKFQAAEMEELKNVGELAALVGRKLASKG
nr:acyl carrier protein [uncultured Rhodopila sp.]